MQTPEALVTPVWQIPAQWSTGRQLSLVAMISCGVLLSGCIFLLYPTWRGYQRLVIETIETEHSLQHSSTAQTLATSHQQPSLPTSESAMMLPTLLHQISQLTDKRDLSLLLLQQQPAALQSAAIQSDQQSQSLVLEITGTYTAISTFVTTLGSMSHCLAIDEMNLGREQPEYPLKLRLSLIFYPSPPLSPLTTRKHS